MRRTGIGRVALIGIVLSALGASVLVPSSAVAQSAEPRGDVTAWRELPVPSPNNPPGMDNELLAVDCVGSDCRAVGLWGPSQLVSVPTFMKLRGNRATTARIPKAGVGNIATDISCVTAQWCMVSGYKHGNEPSDNTWSTLYRNGNWQRKATPSPTNGLDGQAYLFGVSCTSTSHCVAVGWYFDSEANVHGLVLRWNGKKWVRIVQNQFQGRFFTAVDCIDAGNCVIVGNSGSRAVALRLSGSTAKILPGNPTTGSGFTGVDCVTSNWCAFSGEIGTFAYAGVLSGSSWRSVSIGQAPGRLQGLNAISCSAVKRCTAATGWEDATDFVHPAVWQMRGSSRRGVAMPGSSAIVGELNGSSCNSARCVVVGQGYPKGQPMPQLVNRLFVGPS